MSIPQTARVNLDVSSSQCCNLAIILLSIFMKVTLLLCPGVTVFVLRTGFRSKAVKAVEGVGPGRRGQKGPRRGRGCSMACQLIDTLSQRPAESPAKCCSVAPTGSADVGLAVATTAIFSASITSAHLRRRPGCSTGVNTTPPPAPPPHPPAPEL